MKCFFLFVCVCVCEKTVQRLSGVTQYLCIAYKWFDKNSAMDYIDMRVLSVCWESNIILSTTLSMAILSIDRQNWVMKNETLMVWAIETKIYWPTHKNNDLTMNVLCNIDRYLYGMYYNISLWMNIKIAP